MASGRATVAALSVAVVTFLFSFQTSIATDAAAGGRSASFAQTEAVATVAALQVTVITLFSTVNDEVSATGQRTVRTTKGIWRITVETGAGVTLFTCIK